MKTIALFDYLQFGHHLTYLRLFSKTLLEMGYEVMTFCPEPDKVSEWVALHCPKEMQRFYTFKVQEALPVKLPIIRQVTGPLVTIVRWQHTAKLIQQASSQIGHSPDLVFFPWLDSYFSYYINHYIIDRIFPYSWSGLYFHPSFLQSKQPYLPIIGTPLPHYAIAQSSRCCGIGVLEETDAKNLQDKIKNPIIIFPDIADSSPPDSNYAVVKQIREKAGDRKIVGLFGYLCKRKGLLTLLESAQKSIEENWFFVFAGEFYQGDLLPEEVAKVWKIVISNPNNCFFYLERIPNEQQFNALINVCDVLFAAYVNFPSSSNILTKAAIFEKPVIVSDGFCMGDRVKKFQLGLTIPEGNVTKCIEALHYLFDQHQLKPEFESYRRVHSVEQLRVGFHAICQNLTKTRV